MRMKIYSLQALEKWAKEAERRWVVGWMDFPDEEEGGREEGGGERGTEGLESYGLLEYWRLG